MFNNTVSFGTNSLDVIINLKSGIIAVSVSDYSALSIFEMINVLFEVEQEISFIINLIY